MTTKHDMGVAANTSAEARLQPGWLVTPPSALLSPDPNALLLASVNPLAPAPLLTRLRRRLSYRPGATRRSWSVRVFEWLEARAAWQRWLLTAVSGAALGLGLYQSAASSASLQVPSSARGELRAASPPPPAAPQPQDAPAGPGPQAPLVSKAQPARQTLLEVEPSTKPVAKPSVKAKRAYKKHTGKARAARHGSKAQQRRHSSRLSTPRS